MPWRALTLELDRAAAEAFSDALLDAGAQSVCLEATAEPRQKLSALLGMHEDLQALVAAASRAADVAPPQFFTETLEDQDWVRASQAQFAPLLIGERLWVGASWHQAPEARAAVRLDPGLAFGTGSHPTTKLVLNFLEKNLKGGERVLDYGCGSGILAIAAAKLGASQVDAVDLDPQALETTRANARANGIRLRAVAPESLAPAVYDLVVSNILAQPLIVLAPLFATRGARIALSGILETQAREVASAYEAWFDMGVAETDAGWALLAGTRR